MKRILWLVFLFNALLLIACNDKKSMAGPGQTGKEHTSHQTGQSDSDKARVKPGNQNDEADTSLLSVAAAPNKIVFSDQGSIAVRQIDTVISVKGYGYISWDPRRNKKIATRTGGRVERLFVKYRNQYVNRGQKIMELYTPEINAYAAEYLHHLASPGDEILRTKSKEKLRLLGVTESQIRTLETSGFVSNLLTVHSNNSGYILYDAENASIAGSMVDGNAGGSGAMGSEMSGNSNRSQTTFGGVNSQNELREGMYVNRNQTLFYVNDFSAVWGILSFDVTTQSLLKSGMTVVVKSELLELPICAAISFIEPSFNNANQKFMQIRIHLANENQKLKINSLIEGSVDILLEQKLIIPASAVFSLGKRKIVWVKQGISPNGKNIFKAKEIQVSWMDKSIAVIAGGLSALENVAAEAGYLLDSQSLIEQ